MDNQPHRRDLLRELERIERLLEQNEPALAANRCRVCLEAAFKEVVRLELETSKGDARERFLGKLPEGRPIQQLMMGDFFHILKGHPVFRDKRLFRGLNRCRQISNRASHDTDDPPTLREAIEVADVLWDVLTTLKRPEAQLRERCRDRARLQALEGAARSPLAAAHGAARRSTASRLPPPTVLDRQEQRQELERSLALPARTLGLLLHGGADQGHRHLASYCLSLVQQRGRGSWERLDPISWPHSVFAQEQRWGELLERLYRSANGDSGPVVPSTETIVTTLSRKLERGRRRIFLRHLVHAPHSDDALLAERYLAEIWDPVAAACEDLSVVLTFELIIPAASGWWLTAAGREALRASKAARETIDRLGAWQGKATAVVPVPELRSLSVLEIEHYMPQSLRQRLPPGMPRKLAKRLHAASLNGRFDKVVEQLEHYLGRS